MEADMARPQKYAFDEIDDGEVHAIDLVATFGSDGAESHKAMERFRTALRLRAHRANKTAHTRIVRGAAPRLVVQVTRKGERPAEVFGNIDRGSPIVYDASPVACSKCGHGAGKGGRASSVTEEPEAVAPAPLGTSIVRAAIVERDASYAAAAADVGAGGIAADDELNDGEALNLGGLLDQTDVWGS